MGYVVSRYKKLFPLGTFDAPKVLKTWDDSHRLFALNQVRERRAQETLAPGIVMKKGNIDLKGGGFSNYRCYEIDTRKGNLQVVFHNQGEFPVKAFQKKPGLKLLTTLGYFYFTTNPKADEIHSPQIKVNNFFVHQGQLLQLPTVDRSAFIIFKNGKVEIPFIHACGTLKIGQKKFKWRGAKTLESDFPPREELVVYNGSASVIEPYDDPIIGPGRLAKRTLTPKDSQDLIIFLKNKKLVVSQIKDGLTEVTKGLMILSGHKTLLSKVKKGDVLSDVVVDGLKVQEIFDAVSVGPRISQDKEKRIDQLLQENLDDDKALCNRPHREGMKLARAFLAKLKNGKIVSVLIDGIPQAGNIYPGVTPQEGADFIFKEYPQAQEVVATDPGGTMKSVYRDGSGKTQVFGNLHYLDYRYQKNGKIDFWPNGYYGRKAVTFLGVS